MYYEKELMVIEFMVVLFSKLKEKNPRRDGTNGSLQQTKNDGSSSNNWFAIKGEKDYLIRELNNIDETIFLGNTIHKLGVLIIVFHINELGVPHKSNYVFFCNEPIWLPP